MTEQNRDILITGASLLGGEATDTAETDDEDVTLGELAHAIVTEEEAGTLGPRLGRSLLLGLVHWMPRSLRACW